MRENQSKLTNDLEIANRSASMYPNFLILFIGLFFCSTQIVYCQFNAMTTETIAVGTTRTYLVAEPFTVKNFTKGLEEKPGGVSYNPKRWRWSKTFSSTGSVITCLLDNPGNPCYNGPYTITVINRVGAVTLTELSNSGGTQQCVQETTYKATASNALLSYWGSSVTPGAGTIEILPPFYDPGQIQFKVHWSSTFTGAATVDAFTGNEVSNASSSVTVNRIAKTDFNPGPINFPTSSICENQGASLSVWSYQANIPANASHTAKSFVWTIGDNTTPVHTTYYANSSSPPSSLFLGRDISETNGKWIKVYITPDPDVLCLNSYSGVSRQINAGRLPGNYSTIEFVNLLSLTWDGSATNDRCQGGGSSVFNANVINENPSLTSWVLEPNVPGNDAGEISSSGVVTWDTNFFGAATVKVYVYGCGGSSDIGIMNVNVKKRPNNYSLTGPAQLCPNGIGEIVLAGSESSALYELWREETGQWIKVRGQSEVSRWGLPISNISPGKYFVRSSLNGCSLDTQPLTITETTFGMVDLKSMAPKIAFRRMGAGSTQFTAHYSGAPINSDWRIHGGGGTGVGNLTQNGNTVTLDWNPTFTGDATIAFNVTGCAGPGKLSQTITVYPEDENFVQVLVAEESINSFNTLLAQANNPDKVDASTNYIDGLGRSAQIVDLFASPTRTKDIVTPKEYDQYGREGKNYLPFTSLNSPAYRYQANAEQINFYSSSAKIASDNSPYAVTIFEPSPINRVVEQGAPGTVWQPGAGSTVKFDYSLNMAAEVFKFNYDVASGLISLPSAVSSRFYQATELQANRTIDENKNAVIEYVDKLGRTICKKVQSIKLLTTDPPADPVNQGLWASTYYIYDDLGNLAVVLPPEAVVKLTQ